MGKTIHNDSQRNITKLKKGTKRKHLLSEAQMEIVTIHLQSNPII
jgi:hypothetical protein